MTRCATDTASFQKFNMDKWAQPLGDLNFQRASWIEHKQWFWDLRPLIWTFSDLQFWELTVHKYIGVRCGVNLASVRDLIVWLLLDGSNDMLLVDVVSSVHSIALILPVTLLLRQLEDVLHGGNWIDSDVSYWDVLGAGFHVFIVFMLAAFCRPRRPRLWCTVCKPCTCCYVSREATYCQHCQADSYSCWATDVSMPLTAQVSMYATMIYSC